MSVHSVITPGDTGSRFVLVHLNTAFSLELILKKSIDCM